MEPVWKHQDQAKQMDLYDLMPGGEKGAGSRVGSKTGAKFGSC